MLLRIALVKISSEQMLNLALFPQKNNVGNYDFFYIKKTIAVLQQAEKFGVTVNFLYVSFKVELQYTEFETLIR